MQKVKVVINEKEVFVPEGSTILEACRSMDLWIPALCYHPDLKPGSKCKICSVEVEGLEDLVESCSTVIAEGMIIRTQTEKIHNKRQEILSKILENHPNDCLTCMKASGDCELQNLCYVMNVTREDHAFQNKIIEEYIDRSSDAIVRDMNKCILCERCIQMCDEIQGIGIYALVERDGRKLVTTKDGKPLSETSCINCGQCVKVCPVGALHEKSAIQDAYRALRDSRKHVVVQVAPAIKNTLGEEFGLAPGTDVTGKVVAALKKLGADKVFNTDFSADVTIMEEGTELLHRLKEGKNLPLLTSCSPGWIKFVEHNFPQLLPNVSSCKSPQQMFGALAKSYYAEREGINPQDIVSISIMPCTAKKFEANRPEMETNGLRDVDIVLTTRELAKLVKLQQVPFLQLKDEPFDEFLGTGTGAARIFAASGGVMEAALRTVTHILTNGEMNTLDYHGVRGLEGTKEAELEIAGQKLKVAIINGTKHARNLLEKVADGEAEYHFIEVMGCPGGCLGGGGAPIPDHQETREKRKEGLYASDAENTIRRSHENPEVQRLYDTYLKAPASHKAHKLLHTHYVDRSK